MLRKYLLLFIISILCVGCTSGPIHQQTKQRIAPAFITQKIAPALYELRYSAKKNAVYVVSAGRLDQPNSSKILRLDPDTLAVQAEISLPDNGFGLALDEEQQLLYVGHSKTAAIGVVDLKTDTYTQRIQLASKRLDHEGKMNYPHQVRELVLDPEHSRLYVPGLWFIDSVLYIVNTEKRELEKTIPGLGFVTSGIALDSEHKRLFISNLEGKLFTLDTRSLSLKHTDQPDVEQMLNLAYDAQQKRLFASDQGEPLLSALAQQYAPGFTSIHAGNRVAVLDADTRTLVASLPTAPLPIAPLFDPQRKRLFVTERGGGSITVYDTDNFKKLHIFNVGKHPNSLSLNPATGVVYGSIKNTESDEKHSDEAVIRLQL